MNKMAFLSIFVFLIASTATAGNVSIGQKIYVKKLKDACGFDGLKFTTSHTQKEWQAIYDNGKLEEEVKALCPKVEIYEKKWDDHFFAFVYEYAKGSGNEPTCNN